MIKVFINNTTAYLPVNATVLEACESVGVDIPRFCFHSRLSIVGNCRMCLVELEKSPKPVAACVMPITGNMRIFTNTPLVKKAREGTLEFLLLNHPLDCPVCDQGGECDLQDQAMFFGNDKSRFFENKRGVEDKNCGSLIKTIMTRCIHCTRCVRFASEIAGVEILGTTNRGVDTEIGSFLSKTFQSELSGNVIDLCPVGALTSKVNASLARPWEICSTNSIDFSDAFGSNIRVDFKETEIVRVLPRLNEDLNEEWLSDKSRFNFDSLKKQRLNSPYVKEKKFLVPCSWEVLIEKLKALLLEIKSSDVCLLCSIQSDVKTLEQAKKFVGILNIKSFGFPRKFYLNSDFPKNFLCSTKITDIAKSDFCILVGVNPRYEASMLNLRLRKRFRKGLFKVASIGVVHQLTYRSEILGVSPKVLIQVSEGKHSLCKDLIKAEKPILFYGGSLSERKDFFGLHKTLGYLVKNTKMSFDRWNGLCFLNQESNQVAAFDVGLKSFNFSKFENQKVCILLGAFRNEELTQVEKKIPSKTKIVFICSNACELLAKAHQVLPATTFLEKEGFYLNLEGKVQKGLKAISGPCLARNESSIIELLIKKCSPTVYKKNRASTNYRLALNKPTFRDKKCLSSKKKLMSLSVVSRLPFSPFLTDFYISGPSSKLSTIMAQCSNSYRSSFKNFMSF
jgi:NADH dehydrogenase (ubiquinone) Fe-S protein 1